jgi:hypothetical protein
MPGRAGAKRPIHYGQGTVVQHQVRSSRTRFVRAVMLLLAAMSPLLAGAAPPASKCKLAAVAQIPVDLRHLRPVISAAIDGHPADMVVDTGSDISLIYRSPAETFGLKIVEGSRQGYAAGGVERMGQVTVRDFDVAGFMVHNPPEVSRSTRRCSHPSPSDRKRFRTRR